MPAILPLLSKQSYRNISVLLSLIYIALVPAARSLQSYFMEHASFLLRLPLFKVVLGTLAVLILMLVVIKVIQNLRRLPAWVTLTQASALLLAIAVAYFAKALPIEVTHLIQYSALSFSAVRGFGKVGTSVGAQLFLGLMISQVVSLCDEGLQGLHPERFFDFRDLFFNLVGGTLGTTLTLNALMPTLKKNTSTAT